MPDSTMDDPRRIIADLRRERDEALAERDEARTERDESEAQKRAMAEVLHVINASPGDLAPVFDAMLEKATRLCGADTGVLWTYDGDQIVASAILGASAQYEAFLRAGPKPLSYSPAHQRLQAGGSLEHIVDIPSSKAYGEGARMAHALFDLGGIRTILMVPLRSEVGSLGAFCIYRSEARPFTDKQIALLQNFAAQAVIAMENARLLTETREALEQQTATAEVLQVINSSPGDLGPVFDAMLEKAMWLCEADYGHILTFDGQQFHPTAIKGDAAFVEWRRQLGPIRPAGADASPLGRVLQGERVAEVADATQEKAYHMYPRYKELVDVSGIRSQTAVALRKEDVLLGAIVVYRREVRPFTDKQIALLQNFAVQAVIAMENARLLSELRHRTEEVGELNRGLEARVATQVAELERTGKLRRFLAPQLADLIVAQGDESILESHRREIVVVFCDLRGFTAFAERAEPEEVIALLREYHAAMGPIVAQYEGTIDHFSGDGIMVFYGDPLPIADPAKRAIDMAVAMRDAAQPLLRLWRRQGHDLGFGVGIAQGYATLGQIGFAERMDYTAIGTVTNLAARLCAEAKDGQILVARRAAVAVEDMVKLEEIGDLALKGLSQAVAVYNVV